MSQPATVEVRLCRKRPLVLLSVLECRFRFCPAFWSSRSILTPVGEWVREARQCEHEAVGLPVIRGPGPLAFPSQVPSPGLLPCLLREAWPVPFRRPLSPRR